MWPSDAWGLLLFPKPCSAAQQHVVQFYTDDAEALVTSVSLYISEGLRNGESVIVIAAADHTSRFRLGLAHDGWDVEPIEADGHLLFLNAQETMSRFMIDGQPDWSRFASTVETAMERLAPGTGIRAYGEMVGVLWKTGYFSAAIVLEGYWNRFLHSKHLPLFCSYPIDVFDREFQRSGVEALLCDHSHVLSSGAPEALYAAVNRAMDEHLGSAAADVRSRIAEVSHPSWGSIPAAEATILWLRSNAPDVAEPIVRRAQQYYHEATA
jgi:hypothetical protein